MLLMISPSGFHQLCPSPNFIVLRASVNEVEGTLCPSQQLQRFDPTVNWMITKKPGWWRVLHSSK